MAPGQIEDELKAGTWIVIDADEGLVFGRDHADKWRRAVGKRGVDLRAAVSFGPTTRA
ncbi:MAG: hypothetical protein EXQ91_02175 [Alphaproteobacteria bacterium]|nr:hypothetical protein [Alphaproteobacteria bacterium]